MIPTMTGIAAGTVLAEAASAAHDHRRMYHAENVAELKAMRRSSGMSRLLNRFTRHG